MNVGGEASKYGLRPEEVEPALAKVRALPNIDVQGLMTVAPLLDDPERVRPVFRRLREMARALGLSQLSMGMTDDFEVALEEGATMIRIGRAIFGPRPERGREGSYENRFCRRRQDGGGARQRASCRRARVAGGRDRRRAAAGAAAGAGRRPTASR